MHVKDDELASSWSVFLRKVPTWWLHGVGCFHGHFPNDGSFFALEAIEMYSNAVHASPGERH